ncbi:MAG: hypothetical protein QNJ55_10025 [Xenococcus sp. MO_188.B8]|nr:hypothetical protein [Xenococcus sp. MO_188.B8]
MVLIHLTVKPSGFNGSPLKTFSDSQYTAIVSLYGPQSYFLNSHITYHPAFNNTLLGLRLLQADLMFIDLYDFWRLPVLNGNVILGYGESIENQHTWLNSFRELRQSFRNGCFQAFDVDKKCFNSWVLTDYGLKISMLIDNSEFKLNNSPYYYFWKRDGDKAVRVSSLIDRMKSSISAIRNYNPVVFNAATDTMRYAAFFRYLKRTNTKSWNNFLQQISNVQIQPEVKTPTRWKIPLFSSLEPSL